MIEFLPEVNAIPAQQQRWLRTTGKTKPERSRVETSAGHCFDEPCLCASHPCLNINIKAAQLGYTFIPKGYKRSNSSPTRARRKPVVPTCVPKGLYSSPMLQSGVFLRARGGRRRNSSPDRFRHTGFCYSPSVTWSAPTFTRGGLSPGENVIICRTA